MTGSEAAGKLCRVSFYVSILLFFYGTLFPFEIDVSLLSLRHAWSHIHLMPYWDVDRHRIPSLPDIVSNILLTMPLGFFGFLWVENTKAWLKVCQWGLYGLALGLIVEVIQLAMPLRITSATDMLNNAGGAFAGAVLARLLGPPIVVFLARARDNPDHTLAWLLFIVLLIVLLGPFDLTVDVSHVKTGLKTLLLDPWEAQKPISHEWIQTAEFAVFGAVAGRLVRTHTVPFGLSPLLGSVAVLALPFALELGQLFVGSHAPSLRDMALGFLGISGGFTCSVCWPGLIRPATGLALLAAGIIAAGLSPYQFVPWELRADFQWVPMLEYYTRTTMDALYDAGIGIVNFGLLAGFVRASLRCDRRLATLSIIALAGAIEGAQLLLPDRFSGTTDIMMAALGGWAGSTLYGTLEEEVIPVRAD